MRMQVIRQRPELIAWYKLTRLPPNRGHSLLSPRPSRVIVKRNDLEFVVLAQTGI